MQTVDVIATFLLTRWDGGPGLWPVEVHFYSHPNGKVRMHKRGRYLRTDTWFDNFDQAAVTIDRLVNTDKYILRGGYEQYMERTFPDVCDFYEQSKFTTKEKVPC